MPGKDRQRQLAREKLQRQMAKRAEAARRRRRAQAVAGSAIAVVAVIGLAAFGIAKLSSEDKKGTKPSANAVACRYTKPPAEQRGEVPRKVQNPPLTGAKKGTVKVALTTNQGELTLTLDRSKAPCTVNSFVSLVQQKFFDKSLCHRLTTAGLFVLQCGDPSATGRGGPGYQMAEEGLPADTGNPITYPAGTVAMANSGPATSGSQFFLVYKDSPLPPKYTMFGTISGGKDALLAIAAAGAIDDQGKAAGDGKPKKPVTITVAKLT